MPQPVHMITTHTDIVGSLLRPPDLLAAQKQLAAGALSPSQFKEIENRAVDEAITLQEGVGLEIVTDGEMRRQSFQSRASAYFPCIVRRKCFSFRRPVHATS